MTTFTDPYTFPEDWGRVTIGGLEIEALLVAIDGNELEDEWAVQKATGASGATAVFRGTKVVEGIVLTFEATGDTLELAAQRFQSLRTLYELMAPTPTPGGGGSTAAQNQAQLLAVAQVKVNPDGTLSGPVPTAPGAAAKSTQPNPGATPKTLSIRNPLVNYIGVDRISRKKWKGPYPHSGLSWRVDVGVIQYRPPAEVNAAAQSPASADSGGGTPAAPNPFQSLQNDFNKALQQASAP